MTKGPALFSDQSLFESVVRAVLREDSDGSFGRLHIVHIKTPEDDPDWRRLLPKVQAITENIFNQRLSSVDSCLRLADGRYMLLFPTLSESEGRVRAAGIAAEIKQHLAGSASAEFQVSAEVLPLSALRECKPPIGIDHMNHLVDHPPPVIPMAVELQPVWDLTREAIIGSRARAKRSFNGQIMWERGVLFGGEEDPMAVDVNVHLSKAGAAFRPDRGTLFLPVAVNSHTIAHGNGIEDFLHGLGAKGGAKIVVELAGAVAVLPRSILRTAIQSILNHGHEVAARIVPERESARFLHDCGVKYLCLNQMQAQMAGFTPTAIYALYTLVAHDVEGLGFSLCLWNAVSAENVKRAAALGFELFSGAPIGPTGRIAPQVKTLSAAAMFS